MDERSSCAEEQTRVVYILETRQTGEEQSRGRQSREEYSRVDVLWRSKEFAGLANRIDGVKLSGRAPRRSEIKKAKRWFLLHRTRTA